MRASTCGHGCSCSIGSVMVHSLVAPRRYIYILYIYIYICMYMIKYNTICIVIEAVIYTSIYIIIYNYI